MKTAFLTRTLIAAASLMALSGTAQAQDSLDRAEVTPAIVTQMSVDFPSTIGLARIESGRVISAPFSELRDWAKLSGRMDDNFGRFAPISPTAINRVSAPHGLGERESSNKIDEVRLAASDQDMPYVIVYGMGRDAAWGSFGGQTLRETGLVVPIGHSLAPVSEVKAMLVSTYSGTVIATLTSDDTQNGLADLTGKFETLLNALSDDLEPLVDA